MSFPLPNNSVDLIGQVALVTGASSGLGYRFAKVLAARKTLVDNLTPQDDNLTALLNTQDNVDLVDALKGLLEGWHKRFQLIEVG